MNALEKFNQIPLYADFRGRLRVLDGMSDLVPFRIARIFWVEMQPGAVRGGHYHEKCTQAIVALTGRVVVRLDAQRYLLTGPGLVVVADPLKCIEYRNMSTFEVATVLVLCSEVYDPKDVFECPKS